LIPPEEYLQILEPLAAPLPARTLSVADAAGLVLAEDVQARVGSPAFTNSAMDGFACRRAEVEVAFDTKDGEQSGTARMPVSADVPAGSAAGELAEGTVARIMTGAPVPDGADAIIPVEDTNIPAGPVELPDEIEVSAVPAPGAHIRRAGEIMAAGEPVAFAGERVSPFAVGGILTAGVREVSVIPAPRVLVVSTGAELTAGDIAGAAPGTAIPDSNGPMLAALLRQWGCADVRTANAGDTAESIAEVLNSATDPAGPDGKTVDLIVTTGGVSAGAFDPLTMLAAAGDPRHELHFLKVAQQPGKPQGYGRIGGTPLLMLPGNPVSAFVSAWLYVRRVVLRMMNRDAAPTFVEARLGSVLGPFGGKRRFVPARLEDDEFSLLGADRGFSHAVAKMHRANALLDIAPDTAARAGDTVRAIALDVSTR